MSILSSISALKNKVNQFVITNYSQKITGAIMNSILHDITDTLYNYIQNIFSDKLSKSDIGFNSSTGIDLPPGATYKVGGVDILSLVVDGGGPAGPWDASANTLPGPGNGTGTNGAIVNGNFWRVTVASTAPIVGLLPEPSLAVGDVIVASKNNAVLPEDFYSIPGDQEIAQYLSRLIVVETKLATVEEGATADQTGDEIRDLLNALPEQDRLDQTAVKNIQDAPYVNPTYPLLDTIKKGLDNANNNKVDKVQGSRLISQEEITKLSEIEAQANKYVHPDTHPATMIVEDASHRFVTDAEKAKWNGNKVVNVKNNNTERLALTDLSTGERCLVRDDGDGKFAGYWWDGTGWLKDSDPDWANVVPDWDTITGRPNTTPAQIDADHQKLLNIAENANNYVHPETHSATMITEDATHRFVSDTEKQTWNSSTGKGFVIAMSIALG